MFTLVVKDGLRIAGRLEHNSILTHNTILDLIDSWFAQVFTSGVNPTFINNSDIWSDYLDGSSNS